MKYKIFLSCLIITIFLSGCGNTKEPLSRTGFSLNTVITITIYGGNDEILNECFSLCDYYDGLFSRTNEQSEIYAINNSDGAPVKVSAETIELINYGIDYSELSGGLFDITVGPLTSLWDFTSETPKVPDSDDIKDALNHVNYKNIIIDNENMTVCLSDPESMIDAGGIAKGYIADKIKEYLLSENIENAIINLGGNILTIGSKPDGSSYNIGIQEPFSDTGVSMTSVAANDKSVVTSGVYERSFTVDNILYHHILDVSTGYPSDSELLSVTIISDKSVDCDALSTICFLLGKDKATELINSIADTEAIFIDTDYNISYTDQAH